MAGVPSRFIFLLGATQESSSFFNFCTCIIRRYKHLEPAYSKCSVLEKERTTKLDATHTDSNFLRTILHLFSLHAYLPNADIPFVHNRSTQLVLLSSCDLLFFCKWYPQTPSVKTIFNSDHQLVQVSRWSRYQFPTFLLLLLFWFFCQCFVCLVVVFTILFQWKKQTSNFARLQSKLWPSREWGILQGIVVRHLCTLGKSDHTDTERDFSLPTRSAIFVLIQYPKYKHIHGQKEC